MQIKQLETPIGNVRNEAVREIERERKMYIAVTLARILVLCGIVVCVF